MSLGQINKGRVSNARLAGWSLCLLNRNIKVNRAAQLTVAPYALLDGEYHTCPLPKEEQKELKSLFCIGKTYKEAKSNQYDIWIIDNSCHYIDG